MPAIAIQDLSFSYGTRNALTGVSFEVADGTLCGLLGPNGSGKSTLFRVLATLLRPQSGRASICGHDVATDPSGVRRQIGVVFQSPSLDKRLTVMENLACAGRLYGLSGSESARRATELLERVQLRDRARDLVGTLSGGQQRRVEIAKGLLHRPRVLLLDEPSTGLDPAARRSLRVLLDDLRREQSVTILLTTHILDEADHCDRLVIVDAGRVVVTGAPAELKRRIAGECVVVHATDPDALAVDMRARLGVAPMRVNGSVRIESPRAHELLARIVEQYGDRIESITLAKPTLEDVFLDQTGHRLEASDT